MVAEAVPVVGHALLHQLHQQLPPQDAHVQAAVTRRGVDVVGHIHDAALFIHLQIGIAGVAGLRCTNLRQVGPGGDVLL